MATIIIILMLAPLLAAFMWIYSLQERLAKRTDELYRWRSAWEEHRRWLAEFPDVATALDHMQARAEGTGGTDISRMREVMRARRNLREARQDLEAHCKRVAETPFIVPGEPGLQSHRHEKIDNLGGLTGGA